MGDQGRRTADPGSHAGSDSTAVPGLGTAHLTRHRGDAAGISRRAWRRCARSLRSIVALDRCARSLRSIAALLFGHLTPDLAQQPRHQHPLPDLLPLGEHRASGDDRMTPRARPLSTIAAMPIRTRSSTVHPCSVALWPMVTSERTDSGTPGSACNTHPSRTLLPSPTTMVSRQAQHRPVPDARLSPDRGASDEHGTGGDEGSSGDIGAVLAEREQWPQAGAQAVRRLAAARLAWPITRRAVTAAQNAQPEWAQVAAHAPAAGHRLAGGNPQVADPIG